MKWCIFLENKFSYSYRINHYYSSYQLSQINKDVTENIVNFTL